MENNEVNGTMIDKNIVMEIVKGEDWRQVRKYLRKLERDLRRDFERLNECLICPPNVTFCGEVARLVESYNRTLVAVLMLKCLLNETLGVVENGKTRRSLAEVLEVTNDLILLLNEKHDLVHQLMDKCKSTWGDH